MQAFRHLAELRDAITLPLYLEEQPSWFRHAFNFCAVLRLPEEERARRFAEMCASAIASDGKWVAQVEVRAVTHLLGKCGLEVLVANDRSTLQRPADGETLVLLRVGDHFNFVTWPARQQGGGGRTRAA